MPGKPPLKIIRSAWDKALDFVYPIYCIACSVKLGPSDYRRICDSCWGSIAYVRAQIVPLPAFLDGTFCCCLYDGVMKKCIQALKYGRKKWLAASLGRIMGECASSAPFLGKTDLLVPVPMHAAGLRDRGFNQAELLAGSLSEKFKKEMAGGIIVKTTRTKNQVGLSGEQRRHNLNGAFSVRGGSGVAGKNVMLVDDVCTTGATLSECAKILKENGAAKVYALVLAHGA